MSTPGRNDPCLCGSGRKYKYCCLPSSPRPDDPPISIPPDTDFTERDDGPAARILKDFLSQRGSEEFGSLEELNAELKAFAQHDNSRPIDAFEGLSPDQMNAVLYAPLNSPGIIRLADRVEAGPEIPILMMLDEIRKATEKGEHDSCTLDRELQPKLAARIYNALRRMPPFDKLLEKTRVRTEWDVPFVYSARGILEVSGHLRTYASKFILSRSCRKQLKESGYNEIYVDIFRSYTLDFNWSYWTSVFTYDPFQPFFCFTLFQLAKHGDEYLAPDDYAASFFDAFPMIAEELVGDDLSVEATEYIFTLYIIHIVVQFWALFGLVEFQDSDPRSDDFRLVRASPLFRELILFPPEWLAS